MHRLHPHRRIPHPLQDALAGCPLDGWGGRCEASEEGLALRARKRRVAEERVARGLREAEAAAGGRHRVGDGGKGGERWYLMLGEGWSHDVMGLGTDSAAALGWGLRYV